MVKDVWLASVSHWAHTGASHTQSLRWSFLEVRWLWRRVSFAWSFLWLLQVSSFDDCQWRQVGGGRNVTYCVASISNICSTVKSSRLSAAATVWVERNRESFFFPPQDQQSCLLLPTPLLWLLFAIIISRGCFVCVPWAPRRPSPLCPLLIYGSSPSFLLLSGDAPILRVSHHRSHSEQSICHRTTTLETN